MGFIGTLTDTDNSIKDGTVQNKELVNCTVSYGGIQLSLGGVCATPEFNLTGSYNYAAGCLTGTTLPTGLTNSSLTSLGTLVSLDVNGTATFGANLKVGAATTLYSNGTATFGGVITSNVPDGTSPFEVTSTTTVTNLNTDLLDGQEGTYYTDWNNLDNVPTTLGDLVNDDTPQLGGDLETNEFNIQFGDSSTATDDRLQFGVDQDLQIYHDGNDSWIDESGPGNLYLKSDGASINLRLNNTDQLKVIENAATEINYGSSKKFETTASGITVTGDVNIGAATTLSSAGSAEFASFVTAQGAIRAGGGGDLGNSDGVFMGDYGDVHISSVNPTQSAFRVFDRSGGNGNSTIDFKIDGSATFNNNTLFTGRVGINTTTIDSTAGLNVGGNLIIGSGSNTATIAGPETIFIDPAIVGDNTGVVRIKGDLFVDGTTTQINSTDLNFADFVIGIASTASTDLLADGAGIRIGPDNTFLYDHPNTALRSSENLNLASGKTYKINGTNVLSATSLGSNVTSSSLTSVGTINSGTWQGSVISATYIEDKFLRNDANDTTTGSITASRFISNVATGTAPLTVSSTTKVTNLNADLLDGQTGSYYLNTSTNFGGDVSGAYNAIVVANDSHTHDTRYFTETESDTRYLRANASDLGTGQITLERNSASSTDFSLWIKNLATSSRAQIRFSNNVTTQSGYFYYRHEDVSSNSAANSFHFGSSEVSTAVIIDETGSNAGFYVGTNRCLTTADESTLSVGEVDNVEVTTSSSNSNFKIPFTNRTDSTTGYYPLLQDSTATFTYNPSTNRLTVGEIVVSNGNNAATGGGQIYLNGSTGNRIDFNTNGVAAPAFTTRSAGTKLVLYPAISATNVDYALGINGSTLWYSVPNTGDQHRWYGGTSTMMTLTSNNLDVAGTVTGSRLISDVAQGTAPLTVTSTTKVTNLNADLLDDQTGSYYRNATNINAGTLNTARLPNTYTKAATVTIQATGAANDVIIDAADHIILESGEAEDGNIYFRGNGGVDSYRFSKSGQTSIEGFLSFESLTADRTFTFPNAGGTLALTSSTVANASNADTLDGQDGTYYRNATNINAGTLNTARLPNTYTKAATVTVQATGLNNDVIIDAADHIFLESGEEEDGNIYFRGNGGTDSYRFAKSGQTTIEGFLSFESLTANRTYTFPNAGGTIALTSSTVASAGDADTLDGQQGSYYRNATNINAGTLAAARLPSTMNATTFTGNLTIDNDADLRIGDGAANERILIQKADNNVSDHIIFYNATTRVGEIGCEDTTWLRINQETAKNIYTPRYIRADGGFFVDGTAKGINGSGNFIGGTIAGASDYGTLLRSNQSDTMSGTLTMGGNVNPSTNNTYDLGTDSVRWRRLKLSGNIDMSGSIAAGGNIEATGSMRASVYYDTTGTGNYFNPNATGFTVGLITGGTIVGNGFGARAGVNGTYANTFNIEWRPNDLIGWIDTVQIGTMATLSDYRMKRNVAPMPNGALDKIKLLRPVEYQWDDYQKDNTTISVRSEEIREGFIAHEIQEIIPSAVTGEKDDPVAMQSLKNDAILAVVVKALQELSAKNDALEARIAQLESQ